MSKDKYIKEVDEIRASAQLKDRILLLEDKPQKKHTTRWIAAIAACLAVIVICVPALNAMGQSKSGMSYGTANGESFNSDYDGALTEEKVELMSGATGNALNSDRKIIKEASIDLEVRNLTDFQKSLKTAMEKNGGYVGSESASNWDDSRNFNTTLHIPADKLDSFLTELDGLGTVTHKEIGSDDVTDTYVDAEAKLKSHETELETLLGIMKKAENLDDVIKLQDRITQVRGEIEGYKAQLKILDGQVEYSKVMLSVSEESHTVKSDGSFGSQVKEKFLKSIYSLADFFEAFAISFIGSIPYLIIIAVVAVVAIVIVKKKKKK